jgi:hypothetical protein
MSLSLVIMCLAFELYFSVWRRFARHRSYGVSRLLLASSAVRSRRFDDKRRDDRRRFSNVVSTGILGLICAEYGVFWRRRYDWPRDSRRRIVRTFAYGVPRLLLASLAFRSRRRDTWRRFSNVVSNIIPKLINAKCGVFYRRHDDWHIDAGSRFAIIVPHFFPRCFFAWFLIESSSHGLRQFSDVVSDRMPRLVCAKYGVLCRRCDDWHRDAACRFSSIVPYPFPRLFFAWFSFLSRRRDERCDIDFPASCLVASLGSFSEKWNLESVSLRYASWRSASVCQRRVLWLP